MSDAERQHRSNTHPRARGLAKRVPLRVTPEFYPQIVEAAARDRRSLSDFIRIAIEDRIAAMEHSTLQRHRRV